MSWAPTVSRTPTPRRSRTGKSAQRKDGTDVTEAGGSIAAATTEIHNIAFGDEGEVSDLALRFVERGYAVASVGYRLASERIRANIRGDRS